MQFLLTRSLYQKKKDFFFFRIRCTIVSRRGIVTCHRYRGDIRLEPITVAITLHTFFSNCDRYHSELHRKQIANRSKRLGDMRFDGLFYLRRFRSLDIQSQAGPSCVSFVGRICSMADIGENDSETRFVLYTITCKNRSCICCVKHVPGVSRSLFVRDKSYFGMSFFYSFNNK